MPRHQSSEKTTAVMPQMAFDWSRAKRQTWLERLIIPPFEYFEAGVVRTARTGRLKQFLIRLELFARDGGKWSLFEKTIADAMGVCNRTARRLIRLCEDRGLIEVERTAGRASAYGVNWSEVAQILIDNPQTASLVEQPTRPQPTKSVGDASSDTPDNLSDTPDNLSDTPDNLSDTPDNLSKKSEGRTSYSRARGFNQCFQPNGKPTTQPTTRTERKSVKGSFAAGWPFRIEAAHLKSWESVDRLWEHALERAWVSSELRVNFFTLARHLGQRASRGEIENAGGLFHNCVKGRKWLGSISDEDAARRAIAEIDCSKRRGGTLSQEQRESFRAALRAKGFAWVE